jgi:hypothetical protein
MHDLFYKACTDRGLVCSAEAKVFQNIPYVRNVHLTKGLAYSQETNPSSRLRECYIRTITVTVQLEEGKISGRESQGA